MAIAYDQKVEIYNLVSSDDDFLKTEMAMT